MKKIFFHQFKKKFLFVPIIINEQKQDLLIFGDNRIYAMNGIII